MTGPAWPGGLGIGDRIRFGGRDQVVIGVCGPAVRLADTGATVVTDATSRAARQPERREALLAGELPSPRPRKKWSVEWEDDRSPAEMIAGKLLKNSELAREVYKILHAADMRATRAEQNRRS